MSTTLEKVKRDYASAKLLESNPVAYMRQVGPLFEDTLELLYRNSSGRTWTQDDGNLFDLIGALDVDENHRSAWHKMRKMRNEAIHEDRATSNDVRFFKQHYEELLQMVTSGQKVRVSKAAVNSPHHNTQQHHSQKSEAEKLTDQIVKTAVNTGVRALINAIFRR